MTMLLLQKKNILFLNLKQRHTLKNREILWMYEFRMDGNVKNNLHFSVEEKIVQTDAAVAFEENLHQVLVQEASLLITCAVHWPISMLLEKLWFIWRYTELSIRFWRLGPPNVKATIVHHIWKRIHDLARGRKWRKSLSRGLSRLIKVKLCTVDDHHNIYQIHHEGRSYLFLDNIFTYDWTKVKSKE